MLHTKTKIRHQWTHYLDELYWTDLIDSSSSMENALIYNQRPFVTTRTIHHSTVGLILCTTEQNVAKHGVLEFHG